MSASVSWIDIAIRLALTAIAGAIIGFDRGEHGRPAGLRTTILVCLAASVSMIQVNLLLDMAGRAKDSFVMLDLMRLPLGILSGMGFIGGGAILRKGELITGVTTAATLWFVTVMGLCFGGGQIALGLCMLGIGVFVLAGLRFAERKMRQDRHATMILETDASGPTDEEFRNAILADHLQIETFGVGYASSGLRRIRCLVRWRARAAENLAPKVVKSLASIPGVLRVDWRP